MAGQAPSTVTTLQSQESPVHRVTQDIPLRFMQSGKADQSAYIESFNRSYREEVLLARQLDSLEKVREIVANKLRCGREIRPHDVPGNWAPARHRTHLLAAEESRLKPSTKWRSLCGLAYTYMRYPERKRRQLGFPMLLACS